MKQLHEQSVGAAAANAAADCWGEIVDVLRPLSALAGALQAISGRACSEEEARADDLAFAAEEGYRRLDGYRPGSALRGPARAALDSVRSQLLLISAAAAVGTCEENPPDGMLVASRRAYRESAADAALALWDRYRDPSAIGG